MIKVASYCRVSTDKDDQANSFETQKRYFREYIESHPDWELYEIYADEGITGTTTKKRTQFNRMINDAYEGKFQLIITKEVSRFSRNILDTIAYTRELKAIGIGVIFATDRINTLEPEAEMLLSYLASMAQEESRRTSSRVVWGQTRQMERGVVFGRSLLGYDVKDGVLTVNQEGAEIVRLIFHKYAVEQVSTAEIARYMNSKGYCTYRGNAKWKSNMIIKILNNEKYVGDLVQKKTYTPDFLTHAKRTNKGQVPLVTIENHHEPIISREVWNMAQERLQKNNKRRDGDGGHSNRYVFSGKIKCGECGNSFVGRFKYLRDGTKIRRWSCGTATAEGASACDVGKLVRDDDAMQMLKTAIRSLPIDEKAIIHNVTTLALEVIQDGETGTGDDPERLRFEMERVQRKKESVMDSYFSGEITKEDMQAMNRKYDGQIEELQRRQKEAEQRQQEHRDSKALQTAIQSEVSDILSGEIKSEVFCKTMLESLTVFKDRHMELRLNGLPHVFQFAG
ncbi:MAG: recombinase family protein [Oscillospiraceae bacterium]|nr:recombinase family protein [Oscillospiraceae bacterium]